MIKITGRVLDEEDLPLPNATVVIKGQNRGVITDLDGNYSIFVLNENEKLVFTYVGMHSREITVGKQIVINVKLETNAVGLNEVVVQGAYGLAQKRENLVSSAYQVESKQLENLPAARVDDLLSGLIPGLKIDPNSDSPGSTRPRYEIRIRGELSMSASNEPLWIVDGTPMFTGDRTNMVAGMQSTISPLSFINPEDIESMTVLKDASATSIYGANGANGVILVTTKNGKKSNKANFRVSARYGVSAINENTRYKVLTGADYMLLAQESFRNNPSKKPIQFPFTDNDINTFTNTNTDWSKQFYDIGNSFQANLSIDGGSDQSSYYISGSYYRNNGTVTGNTQERYSVRAKNELFLTRKLTLSFNLSASYNLNKIFSPGRDYYRFLPIVTPRNADGSYRLVNQFIDETSTNSSFIKKRFFNSLAIRDENDNNQFTVASNNNAILKYNIIKGLEFTSQLGVDYQSSYEDIYDARTNWSGMSFADNTGIGSSRRGHMYNLYWSNIDRLNYNRTFGNHTVGGLLGFEISSKQYKTVGAYGTGFINDHIKEVSYATDNHGESSQRTERAMSFFGQANYSYKNRYMFSVNARRDGNSSFGSDVRWANFASAGLSWNIHKEDFFNTDVVNVLKIKGSFGSNGNSRLGSQEAQGLYSYSESDRYMGEPGGSLSASPNKGLSWETTYMTNVGLRIGLFERLDIDIEAYNNHTVDLLSNLDVSRTVGDTRVYRNVGEIRNQGIEATITSQNIENKNFSWDTQLNIAHNQNKLLKLYNGISKVMGEKVWKEGEDINTFYLVRWAGVDPRDGAPLWYDTRGNITRSYDINNRVAGVSSAPIVFGGITNNFNLYRFTLRVICSYTIGGHAFSQFGRDVSSDGYKIMDTNQSIDQLNRWQKPGDLALNPKPIWGVSTQSVQNSTRFLYNTTNICIKNISLGYNLPARFSKKLSLKSCNFSIIVDNLAVFTPFDKKGRNSYRNSMSGYPMETTCSIGLNIGF